MEIDMEIAQQANRGQTTLWNGAAGHAWVDRQKLLDRMFRPFEDLLVAAVPPGAESRVLDIGCGTGSTTLAVARRLGAGGCCTGVDISEPMLAAARARAGGNGAAARFLCADAQVHAFEPAAFDTIISRFGVMFFEDAVEAFSNLRRAATDDARLSFIAWRSAAENPFMTTAERTAAPLLPELAARQPGAPGQFAFADRDRVQLILAQGGWSDIDIRAIDVVCTLPEKELVSYLTRLGPLGLMLDALEERARGQIVDTVRAAFEPYVHGDEVRFDAACWQVDARARPVAAVSKQAAAA